VSHHHPPLPHLLRLVGGVAIVWVCAVALTVLVVLGLGAGVLQ
jgi:hypothetical protein